ncbi:MAG: alpha-glucosidase [Gammaproteobacteria bacterium]|nr:alpha-glucosidase [Gammaproteobacteria bacterium]MBV8402556.1 alpha-glucosidase [Gammaproteobacteria bacterium]
MHWPLRRSTLVLLLAGAAGIAGCIAPAAAADAPAGGEPWWRHAVIYEIYPRSFQDANGDGTGDLAGITQRLDYLEQLGVDAIWIAPIYPSPQVDFGYDISDYRGIDPQYGSFADFDRLLGEARRRHIRVILDMVLNHTSDQHPWFIDAAHSRESPHHEFYVWSAGKLDPAGQHHPPNNWVSLFGGPAWEFVPAVSEYYYHRFYRQQPDLNWRNPEVERAMFADMRFWLDRGVAGFRLDAVTELFEDAQLRDAPVLGGVNAQGDPILSDLYTKNLPEVHQVMRRLRAMIDTYPDERVLIGETYLEKTADLDAWYGGARRDELQLPMDTLVGLGNRLDAVTFRRHLLESQTQLHGAQPLVVFDNHDNIRSWDRYGDGVHDAQIARIIAALLLTTRATALVYQGQEIGQRTATPRRVEDVRDPLGVRGWPRDKGRDGERTPMQWDASNPQAGFSSNPHTWLPVTADYRSVNVASESADPASLLNWYRRLIALRRNDAAVRAGGMVMLDERNPAVLSYARVSGTGATVIVSLNMSARTQKVSLGLAQAGLRGSQLRTLLSSPDSVAADAASNPLILPPYAAWVGQLR